MRMLPNYVKPSSFDSERRVFRFLRETEEDGSCICFHSLNLPEHAYKAVAELDFVVLSRWGIIVLEVKGGGVSCDENRIWTTTDRFRKTHRLAESPFEQARSGMYALKEKLTKLLGDDPVIARTSFGYGVIFPDCTFDPAYRGLEDEQTIADENLMSTESIGQFVRTLQRYWRDKHRIDKPLSEHDIRIFGKVIRPEFELVPSLDSRIRGLEEAVERLTDEQYRFLDVAQANPRALCYGGAGTGKTFLAIEAAQRSASSGLDVLIVCRSPVLAEVLKKMTGSKAHIMIKTMGELANLGENRCQADVLIVDEGQDILSFDNLAILEGHLKGGLDNGNWTIFCDPNTQSMFYNDFDEAALDYLKLINNTVDIPLNRNCRNSNDIVLQTKLATGADIGVASAGKGPPVEWEYYSDDDDAAAKLEKKLKQLESGNIPLRDIVVLSPLPFDASSASRLPRNLRRRIEVLDKNLAIDLDSPRIIFSTIEDFKGLERNYAIAIDFNSEADLGSKLSHLYVAMSRPRAGLWVALHERLQEIISEFMISNVSSIDAVEVQSNG